MKVVELKDLANNVKPVNVVKEKPEIKVDISDLRSLFGYRPYLKVKDEKIVQFGNMVMKGVEISTKEFKEILESFSEISAEKILQGKLSYLQDVKTFLDGENIEPSVLGLSALEFITAIENGKIAGEIANRREKLAPKSKQYEKKITDLKSELLVCQTRKIIFENTFRKFFPIPEKPTESPKVGDVIE